MLAHNNRKNVTDVTGKRQKKSFKTLRNDFKNHESIEKNAFRTETKILPMALTAIIKIDIILIKYSLPKIPT